MSSIIEYVAKRIFVGVQCPYCYVYFPVEILGGINSTISNPVNCPKCKKTFCVNANISIDKKNNVIKKIDIKVDSYLSSYNWPVKGPIDLNPIDLRERAINLSPQIVEEQKEEKIEKYYKVGAL